MTSKEKIGLLRDQMVRHGIDFWIIPSSDPHQSEYVAPKWQGRSWISDFTGSAGTVVVSLDHAGLWTDSRYFIQAENQLDDSVWSLHKMVDSTSQNYIEWIIEHAQADNVIGFDGFVLSSGFVQKLKLKCEQKSLRIVYENDLLDYIWSNRPSLPTSQVLELPERFTGKSRVSKLESLSNYIQDLELDHYILTALDDIAWLLNIRSTDIEFNPVVLCYFLISNGRYYLFISEGKLSKDLQIKFQSENIEVHPYQNISNFLNTINDGVFGLNDSVISFGMKQLIKTEIKNVKDYTGLAKAIKNDVEISHIKNAMRKDGIALMRSVMELEETLTKGSISEYDFAQMIIKYRSQQADYFGESFNAIVGYQGNGAIIHYKPEKETAAQIENTGWLLLDCGAQYFDGTTDITRCFSFEPPSEEQKEAYTLVLKGHIQLAMVKFPKGTVGRQLDVLARQALWSQGMDYGHGTGHGVGFFLNVHEAPQGFAAARSPRNETPLEVGMLTSNEPGFYKKNAFGIRIENLVLCVESTYEGFLEFETVTLFPIDTQMINYSLLTKSEVEWLNTYNQRVYDELSPLASEVEKNWLKERCKAI